MPIIQNVSRFLQNLYQPVVIIADIYRQKKFIEKKIEPVLEISKKIKDGSLEENDLKKITNYYSLAVPAILGEAICALHGKRMSEDERLTSTCQGAMTGLGDDFFDKQRMTDEGLKEFVINPQLFEGNTASEKLFLHIYKTALSHAPDQLQMQEQLVEVYYAQLLSKKQSKPGLSYEEIKDISFRKGGESLLFYRTAFNTPYKKWEEKMLYSLGSVMQIGNDIFDVHKDCQNGIDTLLTTCTRIKELRLLFETHLRLGIQAAYRSGYPIQNIKRFLGIISLGVFSRCLVCLDQLEKLEKKTGNKFDLNKYKRSDLICDMDTVSNKWKSLRYHLKIMKTEKEG